MHAHVVYAIFCTQEAYVEGLGQPKGGLVKEMEGGGFSKSWLSKELDHSRNHGFHHPQDEECHIIQILDGFRAATGANA